MILTEKHSIKKSNSRWKNIDIMSFYSKNLYNQVNYYIKKHYEETGKFLRYNDLEKIFRTQEYELTEYDNYHKLPNNTSQQIMMVIDRSYTSFFKFIRKWKKNKKSLSGCPHSPKYKKKNGRNVLIFTQNQVKLKKGYVHFPKKMNIVPIKTNVDNIKQVRIIPNKNKYTVEIIYNFEEINYDLNKNNYLSIDLGLNNLVAITTNQPNLRPLLINGNPLKSMNQYYNKKKAKIQSQLKKNHGKTWSNQLSNLTSKHQNKSNHYLHHVSKMIIQYAIDNDICTIIIGHNKGWKQNINIGKVNNQKFVQIPFNRLIDQIRYKGQMIGIEVIETEESYTSKTDHLALEEMKHHEKYSGKRIKRGLFKTSKNVLLNADVNGSIGIMRKVIGNEFIIKLNRGCVTQPIKVNPL